MLDENRLERIDDDAFRATTNLQQLWLNGNRLRALPRALPATLERLFVDSNRLESLTAADFTPPPPQPPPPPGSAPTRQLATLSAMSNNISRVAGDALAGLPRLASLDLAANRIRALDAGTFAANGHLRALALSKNPLESFGARCMAGLRRLETLALAYVPTPDVRLADDAFGGHLPALRRLDATHSPGLVAALMRSDRALGALGAVRDLGRPARSVQGPSVPSVASETSVALRAASRGPGRPRRRPRPRSARLRAGDGRRRLRGRLSQPGRRAPVERPVALRRLRPLVPQLAAVDVRPSGTAARPDGLRRSAAGARPRHRLTDGRRLDLGRQGAQQRGTADQRASQRRTAHQRAAEQGKAHQGAPQRRTARGEPASTARVAAHGPRDIDDPRRDDCDIARAARLGRGSIHSSIHIRLLVQQLTVTQLYNTVELKQNETATGLTRKSM